MLRRLENPRDDKVRLFERLDAHDGPVGQADRLPDREFAVVRQLFFDGALPRRLGQAAGEQHRPCDLLRDVHDRDIRHASADAKLGAGLQDRLRRPDAGQGADGLQIFVIHQQGGVDLEVPEPAAVKEDVGVLLQGGCGIGNAEVCHRRQHADHHDRQKGDQLLPDVAAGIGQLCSFHSDAPLSVRIRRWVKIRSSPPSQAILLQQFFRLFGSKRDDIVAGDLCRLQIGAAHRAELLAKGRDDLFGERP